MELLQELFMTSFVAFVVSLLVAKLVSIALNGDGDGHDYGLKSSKIVGDEAVVEDLKLDRGVKVKGTKKSKKKVQFAVDEVVSKVDKFEGQQSADHLEEEFVEKSCDLGEICDAGGQIEVEENAGEDSKDVGLSVVKSPELGFSVEKFGGFESEESKKENIESRFDGLVAEPMCGDTKADEFCGVREENTVNTCVYSTVVGGDIGNKKADDQIGVKLVNDDIVDDQSQQVRIMCEIVVEENIADTCVDSLVAEEDGGDKMADDQIGVKLLSDDIVDDQSKQVRIMEIAGDQGTERELNDGEEEKEGLICDEDDGWEGIERSELENVFSTASNYANADHLLNLESDVQMQLYGLHKVSMEGPCREAQPMALKVSARAKWNAWQKLGNMSPEVAMEQFIRLLSDKVPGWSQGDNSAGDVKLDSSEAAKPGFPDPNITSLPDSSQMERNVELKSSFDGGDLTGGSNSVYQDKE